MKKSLFCITLALLTVFSLLFVSCGSNNENEKSNGDVSETKSEAASEQSKEVIIDTESLYANADKTTLAPGDMVIVTVGFNTTENDSAVGIDYEYDDNSLELTSLEWLLKDAFISDSTLGEVAVIAYEEAIDITGDIIKFGFKVKEDISLAETAVKITAILDASNGKKEYDTTVTFTIQK